ncbi:hypothetical protein GCM10008018_07410 [Paenibacillus marchantiophytorum]|uniref:Uncharacterized protein n=1 Tax=Paenibacillus marchantiophytorum TaxID=1619310 RepID=A0ABQ2BS27_9BACL|nr:hypothetical protein [Paenibacillus marchantiophytorum]GGI44499.1 hypothetical protein GCM10008018_07410 [Paenibacillus marchantiophytorum]
MNIDMTRYWITAQGGGSYNVDTGEQQALLHLEEEKGKLHEQKVKPDVNSASADDYIRGVRQRQHYNF